MAEGPPDTRAAGGDGRGTLSLLLVEDNPGDARLFREMLADGGLTAYGVTHVARLAEALSHLDRERPGAVLLDLQLPDSSGIDTLVAILEAAPRVPVVVLTGLDEIEAAQVAVQEGAQDYLVKDRVTPHVLRRSLRYAIQRQDVLDHLGHALEEVRRKETVLRQVLAHCRHAVLVVDGDGRIRFVNEVAERIYGRPAHRLVGEGFGLPLAVGKIERVVIPRLKELVPVEMRTAAVEWSEEPAWLVWMRETGRTPAEAR